MNLRPVTAALLLGAWAGCYQAPALVGPYRCNEDATCGEGLVCDEGVCCNPTGEPLCLSYVLDGGTCHDGSPATEYYADLDGDGFGNQNEPRLYCAPPVESLFVAVGGDCNDNPDLGGGVFYPGAKEQCDGVDNDCDGVADNGFAGTAFYPDLDGDGFGDKSAAPETLCAPREGMVSNALDCNDNIEEGGASQHPGASERCNGRDDDCNGLIDDDVTGLGVACTVPGKLGECLHGVSVCTAQGLACQSTVQAQDEICDGKDNDCDGETDEKPDCAGPLSLQTAGDVTFGAKKLTTSLNGQPSSCVKGNPGTAESFDGAVWSATGAASQVAWVERRSGYWDLSRADAKMKLKFTWTMTSSTTPAWADHSQPVILLCGPQGYVRLVYTQGKQLVSATGTFDKNIPLQGGLGWVVGSGSNPAALKQVERIEVLVQPNYNATPPPFTINVSGWGFP